MAIKSLSIRIDSEMLDKLHYIADYSGRSANSQILVLIRHCIDNFEKQNGEITFNRNSTPVIVGKREKKSEESK